MKLFSKIVLFLLIAMVMITICSPLYAAESKVVNDVVYGINKTHTTPSVNTNGKPTYSITPKSRPCSKKILKYTTYNRYTKNCYTIISYMEKFERNGGGTLILKKGTYYLSNSVPIPSNVNIILEDGVVINKGTKSGTKKFKASVSIFQLVQPSKLKKKKVYTKYNGVRNVNIVGKGSAVINLRYLKKNVAIVCGHSRNIRIQGITFKNLNTAHFIEVDATRGLTVSNCKFLFSKRSPMLNGEAINLDIPDKNTQGFNNQWATQDKTPNQFITIENNVFYGLDRAIGSHKYSQWSTNGKYVTNKGMIYHTNIIIRNNKMVNMRADAIHVLNWKNVEITNNYISTITRNYKNFHGILAGGVINLKVKYNLFENMNRPLEILVAKNNGVGSMYSYTYNTLNDQNYRDMVSNYCYKLSESFARITFKYHYYDNQVKIGMLTG